jgi:hypothetical protein
MGCTGSTPAAPQHHTHTHTATYAAPAPAAVYHPPQIPVATPVYNDDKLRVLSNPNDVIAYSENLGVEPPGYISDTQQFSPELVALFERYEVPLGLINKLRAVETFSCISFVVDDSGSMQSETDSKIKDLTPYIAKRYMNQDAVATRWMEAEDRIHILWDLVRFIPNPPFMRISFLNRPKALILTKQQHAVPESTGHDLIEAAFADRPGGGTPLQAKWYDDLTRGLGSRVMHFWATDGVPNGGAAEIDAISRMVLNRVEPQNHPIAFLSCSNVESETGWLRDVDGACRRNNMPAYVGEYDDYRDEAEQVKAAQGPYFCFTKGFYYICMLVGAINPDDLDKLDERKPLSKDKLEELMGRPIADAEYRKYATQPHFFA